MGKLEDVLNTYPEIRKEERNLFSNVYMTEDAFKKINMFASYSKNLRGGYFECYGYLLGKFERKNRIVDDIYLAPDQRAESAHVQISSESVSKSGEEIRGMDKKVLGWWHSHGGFSIFHSTIDDKNFIKVLDQVASSNYIMNYKEIDFLTSDIKKTKNGDYTLMVCDKNNRSKRLEMIFSEYFENPLNGTQIDKLKIRIPMKISFGYSVVVNGKNEKPYSQIAIREFCSACLRDEYKVINTPIKIIKGGNLELDENLIEEEVNEKINLSKSFYYKFGKYFNKKKKRKRKKRKG